MIHSGFNIEEFARDLAFEMCLGGDRFDHDDAMAFLEGISARELDRFTERVKYHAEDFKPRGGEQRNGFDRFVSRYLGSYLADVRTAERLGISDPVSEYEGVDVFSDRGKWFLMDSGRPAYCMKATRWAMWGKDIGQHIRMEIDRDTAVRSLFASLLSRYGVTDGEERRMEFVSPASVPEGDLVAICDRADAGGNTVSHPELVMKDGSRISLYDVMNFSVGHLSVALVNEDLRREEAARMRRESHRKDVREFRHRAGELIDSAGLRTMYDFLYDEVDLGAFGNGSLSLRREVNDLMDADDLSIYVTFKSGGGRSVTLVSEKVSPEVLSTWRKAVDSALGRLGEKEKVSVGAGRIDLDDGPVVGIPEFGPGGLMKMKVSSVFIGYDLQTMVEGTVVTGTGEKGPVRACPLALLSDKGVEAVRKSTDAVISRLRTVREEKGPEPAKAREPLHKETAPSLF
jgi:hypothetical protein